MKPEQFKEKLEAAGCCFTSAGVIAVDTRKLVTSHIAALQEIERLETALASRAKETAA